MGSIGRNEMVQDFFGVLSSMVQDLTPCDLRPTETEKGNLAVNRAPQFWPRHHESCLQHDMQVLATVCIPGS